MCGRFTRMMSWRQLHRLYNLSLGIVQSDPRFELPASSNVAPSEWSYTIRGGRELDVMEWGFVPAWRPTKRLFNAKAETLGGTRAFAGPLLGGRCVVPVSEFVEWPTIEGKKRRTHFGRVDGAPMLLAGLFEGERFTIVTTRPNEYMARFHDRMPAILEPEAMDRWLRSPDVELLAPAAEGILQALDPGWPTTQGPEEQPEGGQGTLF